MTLTVSGGPHDGLSVSTSIEATFLWFDGKRAWRNPGKNRVLYARATNRYKERILIFAGFKYALCECGSFVRKPTAECPTCGAALTARA